MRTVVNIRTGGQTKISGIKDSFLLPSRLLWSWHRLPLQIPHAVLAGILVKVTTLSMSYLRMRIADRVGISPFMVPVLVSRYLQILSPRVVVGRWLWVR